jgi:hypothetical protein
MKAVPITVYLPDTRGVEISRYGMGNLKIGLDVFTYSRLPGGTSGFLNALGTCPGATVECEDICYAKRISGAVREVYQRNSSGNDVPPIPEACKILRLHVSGDFDSVIYIENWIERITARPDVMVWAYTRSWRVPSLLPALERLRALPNVQLFASMDPSTKDAPPAGWRRSWIHRNEPKGGWPMEQRLRVQERQGRLIMRAVDGVPAFVCPEETGEKPNCISCGYCFEGRRNDVVFLEH